jgi:hypothetical protein
VSNTKPLVNLFLLFSRLFFPFLPQFTFYYEFLQLQAVIRFAEYVDSLFLASRIEQAILTKVFHPHHMHICKPSLTILYTIIIIIVVVSMFPLSFHVLF